MRHTFPVLVLLPLVFSPLTASGESHGDTLVCQGVSNLHSTAGFPRLFSGKGDICSQQWQDQGTAPTDKEISNAPMPLQLMRKGAVSGSGIEEAYPPSAPVSMEVPALATAWEEHGVSLQQPGSGNPHFRNIIDLPEKKTGALLMNKGLLDGSNEIRKQWERIVHDRTTLAASDRNHHLAMGMDRIYISTSNQKHWAVIAPVGPLSKDEREKIAGYVLQALIEAYQAALDRSGFDNGGHVTTSGEADDDRNNREHNRTGFDFTLYFQEVDDTEDTASLVEYHFHQQALRERFALLRTLDERLREAIDDGNTQLIYILTDRITLVEAFISDHFLGTGNHRNRNSSKAGGLSLLLVNTYLSDRKEVQWYRDQKKITSENQTTAVWPGLSAGSTPLGRQAPDNNPQETNSGRQGCWSTFCSFFSGCSSSQNTDNNTAGGMGMGNGGCNGDDGDGDGNGDRNYNHKTLDVNASQVEKDKVKQIPHAPPTINSSTVETKFRHISRQQFEIDGEKLKIITEDEWSTTREALLPDERRYPREAAHYTFTYIGSRIDDNYDDNYGNGNFKSIDERTSDNSKKSYIENLTHHEYALCLDHAQVIEKLDAESNRAKEEGERERVAEKTIKSANDLPDDDGETTKDDIPKKLKPLSDDQVTKITEEFKNWKPKASDTSDHNALRIQTESNRYNIKETKLVPVNISTEAADQTGIAYSQGNDRQTMEDTHIVETIIINILNHEIPVKITGVFDGHGGSDCAEFAAKNVSSILKTCLEKFNSNGLSDEGIWNALKIALVEFDGMFFAHAFENNPELPKNRLSGTTANIALMIDGDLWIANLGDSRAVLMGKDVGNQTTTMQVSWDQKPDQPIIENGIRKRGGALYYKNGKARLDLVLAVGRALGNNHPAVSSRPKITKYSAEELKKWDVLIQGCDGIWDVYTSASTGELISEYIQSGDSLEMASAKVVRLAIEKGSRDNLTLMTTKLDKSHN